MAAPSASSVELQRGKLDFFNTRMKVQRSSGCGHRLPPMTAGIAPTAHDRCCCNGQPGAANTVKKIAPSRKCASNPNEAKCGYSKICQRSPVDDREMRI